MFPALGLISEKAAVVIDLGCSRTKIGFAGERRPRAVVNTPHVVSESLLRLRQSASDVTSGESAETERSRLKTEGELYDSLFWFFHDIYGRHLLVSPKERRVVLVQKLMVPDNVSRSLVHVLFRHFHVISVTLVSSEITSLVALGISDGLVVDCGYQETTILAIYDLYPVMKSWHSVVVGGRVADDAVRTSLINHIDSDSSRLLTDDVVEDVKVRHFVVPHTSQRMGSYEDLASATDSSTEYYLPDSQCVTLDSEMKNSVLSILFDPDDDGQDLTDVIIDAIKSCPIDIRRHMASNIVLIGGQSMQRGFRSRLARELIAKSGYECAIHIDTADCLPLALAWTGASIYAASVSFPHMKVHHSDGQAKLHYPPSTCVHVTRDSYYSPGASCGSTSVSG